MSFADDLKRALVTYRRALLSSDGPAVDTARDIISNGRGGHGKHGQRTAHLLFARDLPLPVEMERSFARWCDVWELKLERAEANAPSGDTRSAARRAQTQVILDEVGMDPTAVAFIYGQTTDSIRKLRGRHGLDPDTGERIPRRGFLTEHPRETLKRHESATTPTPEEA